MSIFITHRRMALRQETDAVGYPIDEIGDCVLACSTVQLSSTATYCMRVRRGGDNEELDIGFSGGVIDEAALLAHCGGAGGDDYGYVVNWYDQSGNSNDFDDSGTSTYQPMIVDNGSMLANVYFSGSAKRMRVPNHSSLQITAAITICINMHIVSTGSTNFPLEKASSYMVLKAFDSNPIRSTLYIDGSTRTVNIVATPATGTLYKCAVTYDSALGERTLRSYLNGVFQTDNALSGLAAWTIASTTNDLRLNYLTADRAAYYNNIVIFNKKLTADEIMLVQGIT